jgi:DNA methylase
MTQGERDLKSEPGVAVQRFTDQGSYLGVPCKILDIPESIPALGYGSHQFFRYYGKFPSLVGREIIARFHQPGRPVLDCYAGSGTTLVEAQIRGLTSYGMDINPLAVLAATVKTAYYSLPQLESAFVAVMKAARAPGPARWIPQSVSGEKLAKWFSREAVEHLSRLRTAIEDLEPSPEKLFFLTCFLAIVRRTSNAFDGEVRPHVNKEKKPREPFIAFENKFADMRAGLNELDEMRPEKIAASCVLADNREVAAYSDLFSEEVGLVVAHPPYLNSFNYLQVFGLEFMWGEDLPELWGDWTMRRIRAAEHKAWPATDVDLVERYYADFFATAKAASARLASGGVLAVVVGDATVHGRLEPVHRKMWEGLTELGLAPEEIWLRTTHYGIGKYAYSHRADYHGEARKKDAILFLRNP